MTLSQTTAVTRKGIVFFGIFLLLVTLSLIGYNLYKQYELAHRKPIEEKPEMRFGTLPKIKFPAQTVSSSNFTYSLDTTTGELPQVPKLLKVYFIPQTGISLMDADYAKQLAEKLGFPQGPQILATTEYKFTNDQDASLIINITTGNFHFQRQVIPTKDDPPQGSFPEKERLIGDFKQFLSSKDVLPPELQNGTGNVTYSGSGDEETAHLSLWPADIDKMTVITPQFTQGLVRATVTKHTLEANKYIDINFIFWPVDKASSSTYLLKLPAQAFSELKIGQGFVALEPDQPQVSISSVYLAYYQSESYSPYLQPVYVFDGPQFIALVPAIGASLTPTDATPK
ncbi:MAG: hypothetical protein UU73_C0001G0302 [Candidatus Daviesbacteria bacterium GW2011_GWA1_41_61]|uniref:Uncharacterized protein n=1 Tax=Candidatus Daviesbacteria bacterium GW2011_GWA2_40_9 TaxID=1618424 RepID=A0A0G0X7E0_9BACT|nr:MAG: hypothetical protein UU29_C0004G0053 [Candidatus Daviesbacteria bacterium GW2011_GWA2_40_9]KKR93121.1 MAG: hypothetical protein UU44_C0004G0303 [Candidatus Daviesbacteria bacterium GW2011_GWB1_41_15]KKS15665.1 MAG: hypothetical protein UU73_C0001G0302 [Candidatus Daviesbacteria bacterium GW2011_GWA1_41_61]